MIFVIGALTLRLASGLGLRVGLIALLMVEFMVEKRVGLWTCEIGVDELPGLTGTDDRAEDGLTGTCEDDEASEAGVVSMLIVLAFPPPFSPFERGLLLLLLLLLRR